MEMISLALYSITSVLIGGAVEMILTKPKVAATPVNTTNSDGNSSKNVLPLSMETLGYLSLVGNTFLMVSPVLRSKGD